MSRNRYIEPRNNTVFVGSFPKVSAETSTLFRGINVHCFGVLRRPSFTEVSGILDCFLWTSDLYISASYINTFKYYVYNGNFDVEIIS